MNIHFGRARDLATRIDAFLDHVDRGILAMDLGIRSYLDEDKDGFERQLTAVTQLEHDADQLVQGVQRDLYAYSLLPEHRGDVFQVLEEADTLLDRAKAIMRKTEIEIPRIPEEHHAAIRQILDLAVHAADHVVRATRLYFREPHRVQDDLVKVDFYEGEADEAVYRLKKAVFRSDLGSARKQHLRDFIDDLDSVADLADRMGALLGIAAIRRVE